MLLKRILDSTGVIPIERKILVVDKNSAVCREISSNMKDDFTDVRCMESAMEALASYMKEEYCLVILDVQSMDMNSLELLRTMRNAKHTPILALTDPLKSEDIVTLFHAGADACLEKPIDVQICAAQANALIHLYFDTNNRHKSHNAISFGSAFIISPRYRQVIVDGEVLSLTRKEFDLLHCLASYPGQVFSLDHLYAHVWDDEFAVNGEETVRVHIQTLRRKLTALGKDFIQNIWGVGYKFVPPG